MAFNIVLFEPEIAPNTGNIIRICANMGSRLHLVGKLGFDWDDKKLRRAGLDYSEWAEVVHWPDLENLLQDRGVTDNLYAFTTKASRHYHNARFNEGDYLLFGPETRGLPEGVLKSLPDDQKLRLPMVGNSRSLNLSNSVAIAAYEAWRQTGFAGCKKV